VIKIAIFKKHEDWMFMVLEYCAEFIGRDGIYVSGIWVASLEELMPSRMEVFEKKESMMSARWVCGQQ